MRDVIVWLLFLLLIVLLVLDIFFIFNPPSENDCVKITLSAGEDGNIPIKINFLSNGKRFSWKLTELAKITFKGINGKTDSSTGTNTEICTGKPEEPAEESVNETVMEIQEEQPVITAEVSKENTTLTDVGQQFHIILTPTDETVVTEAEPQIILTQTDEIKEIPEQEESNNKIQFEFKQTSVIDFEQQLEEITQQGQTTEEAEQNKKASKFYCDIALGTNFTRTVFSNGECLGLSPDLRLQFGRNIREHLDIIVKLNGQYTFKIKQNNPFERLTNNITASMGVGASYSIKCFALDLSVDFAFINQSKTEVDVFSMIGATLEPSFLFYLSEKSALKISVPVQGIFSKAGNQINAGLAAGFRFGGRR